ncbi:unnamed protein product [Rhizoctonia solani]|uniref:pectinesterase n=1 Tax=Rhizoctonia solani TaxID=456999 RepID=A0A8H3HJD8_9AGAM|nr:unnamed protein product [Rhizoctonia solani]
MRSNTLFVSSVSLLSFFISSVLGLTSPPSNAITVGKNGKYASLAKALEDTSSDIYFVYAGAYTEQVVIDRPDIKIYGQTSQEDLTYVSNQATITNNRQASILTFGGFTSPNLKFSSIYNLNIANTYGKPQAQSQAIALSVQAGQFGCYGCRLTGYQDTLLANKGGQFYGKSFIEGQVIYMRVAVDFIFGQQASVWITDSTLNTIGKGYITASGRSTNDNTYYVIDNSKITGAGAQLLGRPWRSFARVIVQNTDIGSHVGAAGWSQWSTSSPNTESILFGEYDNSGEGSWKSGRASFATKLSAGISISTALGNTDWIDLAYL